MKLGIGFNVFSGLELLEPAIMNCRDQADYIILVYQLTSNTGVQAPEYIMDFLDSLKGLVDGFHQYEPPVKPATTRQVIDNNIEKREIARQLSKVNGCTHFQCRDCDEFYIQDEFEKVKEISESIPLTYGHLYEYLFSPMSRKNKAADFYVPFIHDVELPYTRNLWSCKVDPGRRVAVNISTDGTMIPESVCTMHHMTRVRLNEESLRYKFKSHSIFQQKSKIEWLLHEKAKMVTEPDRFGIYNYWQDGWRWG